MNLTIDERCAVFVAMIETEDFNEFSKCYNILSAKETGKKQIFAWENMTGEKLERENLTPEQKKERRKKYYQEWEKRNRAKRREYQRQFALKKRIESENNI